MARLRPSSGGGATQDELTGTTCPSCGQGNRDTAAFCDRCGGRLIGDAHPDAFARGRYTVERLLGEGAYKRVYLARDTKLDREVAFALVKRQSLRDTGPERVRREILAMGRMSAHPNLVTVYDTGEEAGCPYIVEEYLEGGTVADLLRQSGGRPLALETALRIAAGVCVALDHVHERGIVHRDVKPDNVWLAGDGTPKLGDFGLHAALRQPDASTVARLTAEGTMLGTLAYMPPEQALDRPVGPWSDLYSLGAMLYETVTGAPPFAGDDELAIISQHLRTAPVGPRWHNPELPAALDELIVSLLAKDPRDRPQSARAVGIALSSSSASAPTDRELNPLEGLAGGIYVGREREIDELCAAVDAAVGGRGRVALIAGEPGIGKTRLAEQLTTYAQLRGAATLWGRCYEGDGAPPFWPWVQVIRSYASDHDPELLRSLMGPGAPDIAQMVSVVRERLPDLPEPPALAAEQARFRLFDSVTTFLANASFQQPLVIVLDDLHHADRSSLMLLEFLARELAGTHLLVVGTYRDTEPGALTHTLGELARVHPPARIELRGLTSAEVARYIEMTAGVEPEDDLVARLHAKSEGNPLFVAEMVRLLSSGGPDVVVPGEVRELIGRRLSGLGELCRQILTVAAVTGRDFHVPVVQQAVDLPSGPLLQALDDAVAARVVTETAPGRYRFSHALIADTLLHELPSARRAYLHHRIAKAGEAVYADDLARYLNMLAHHFLEAAAAGGLEQGLHYAIAAGEQAAARLAYEEAARLYERALAASDLAGVDARRRCELLLLLGDAHACAGATDDARDAFGRAAQLARRTPSPECLARAALGFGGPRVSFGVVDAELVALLEEALEAGEPALRSRLLARLAMELAFAQDGERRAALIEEAVAIARETDDIATLAYVLNARHAVVAGPAHAEERLAIAGEVIALAERAGDRELALEGHGRRAVTALEIGDAAAAAEDIEAHARLAAELRQPYGLWQATAWRATRALLAGELARAHALAQEAYALGERVRATDAAHCFAIQSLVAALGRDRLGELTDTFEDLAQQFPATRWREAGLPFVYAELGRREEAAEAFERVASAGFDALPRDNQWLVSITAIADCCAFLGDVPRAKEIYALMEPYAGRSVVMPEGWACFGTADRALGLLATTMGDWERAEAHFEVALGLDEMMGARAWRARTQQGYARMLLARGADGDTDRARELLAHALAGSRELALGM